MKTLFALFEIIALGAGFAIGVMLVISAIKMVWNFVVPAENSNPQNKKP